MLQTRRNERGNDHVRSLERGIVEWMAREVLGPLAPSKETFNTLMKLVASLNPGLGVETVEKLLGLVNKLLRS